MKQKAGHRKPKTDIPYWGGDSNTELAERVSSGQSTRHGKCTVCNEYQAGQQEEKCEKRAWISIPTCMASAVLRDSNNFEALVIFGKGADSRPLYHLQRGTQCTGIAKKDLLHPHNDNEQVTSGSKSSFWTWNIQGGILNSVHNYTLIRRLMARSEHLSNFRNQETSNKFQEGGRRAWYKWKTWAGCGTRPLCVPSSCVPVKGR